MKKFMKAIAFVTVMCMALSTVAFADNGAVKSTTDDKTVIVTVTTAGSSDQVALMVVDAAREDYDFSDPLYIDQKGATSGAVEFTAKIARDVDEVAVYVGYAANGENPAIKVGTVKLVQPITEVTVSSVAIDWANYKGEEQTATGATLEFTVSAPEGTVASKMVWAIDSDAFPTGTKYSKVYEISEYGIGTIINNSAVKLGLAFLNGSLKNEVGTVTIENIRAYFLFVNSDQTTDEVEVKNN